MRRAVLYAVINEHGELMQADTHRGSMAVFAYDARVDGQDARCVKCVEIRPGDAVVSDRKALFALIMEAISDDARDTEREAKIRKAVLG